MHELVTLRADPTTDDEQVYAEQILDLRKVTIEGFAPPLPIPADPASRPPGAAHPGQVDRWVHAGHPGRKIGGAAARGWHSLAP